MRARDKIALGWIDPGQVDGMFAMSMMSIYAERLPKIGAVLRVEGSGLLSRMRNELVTRFLDTTDCQWLLMIDSDEQLSTAGFDKLVGSVHDKDRPIMAGLYFGAWPGEPYPQPVPLIYQLIPDTTRFTPIYDYPDDAVIPVDGAGTGCLLVHRGVFEKIREGATEHEGTDWCWFHDMPVRGDWFAEDLFFCRRAASLGFPIHANTGVILPHRKRFWLTEKHFRPAKEG
jgi:hypothetical protein